MRRCAKWSLFLAVLFVLPLGITSAKDEPSSRRKPIESKGPKTIRPEEAQTQNVTVRVGGDAQSGNDGSSVGAGRGLDAVSGETAYPSTAPQQQGASAPPPARSIASSPGSDSALYVPGSSVENFRMAQSLKLGPILFRPSGRIHYFYESNLLTKSGSDSSTHAILIEPTLEALIPITQNGIRFDYSMLYRDYNDFDLRHKVAHHLNADSRFDLTPIFNLSFAEHYALSSLESSEFVPGREVIFSDAQFKRNDLSMQASWDVTDNNNLSLRGNWNRVSFDESNRSGARPFYDYDQYSVGGTYRRDVSPRTGLFGGGTYLRDVADDPRGIATSRGYETVVGIDSQFTPLMSGQLSAGFRSQTFRAAEDQNYHGAVLRGSLQKDLTQSIRVGVAGSRSTNISNFERNAYYLTHGIGFSYYHELRPNLALAVNPGYQRNSYPLFLSPSPGVSAQNRVDRIYDVTIAARYKLNALLGLEVRYDYIRRRSVLPELTFTNYRAGVSLLIGQRGITRGRAPY